MSAASARSATSTASATGATSAVAVPRTDHIGLITRTLAFGVDVAAINLIAVVVAAIFALTFDVLNLSHDVRKVLAAAGGVAYVLWSVGYFVVFWSTTGQTPGDRVMRIRVRPAAGGRLLPRRALLRFVGLIISMVPLFAGFLWILVDDQRRGWHDLLARTVVVDAEQPA